MAPPNPVTKRKKEDDDAFPTQQLTVLALCRVAEPIAFTSILSYSYVMVQDLHGGDDTNASFYAGILVSAFAIAEASTAMIWGSISDRVGRKPIVLMGLAGTALSSLLFGFSTKYWMALVARLIGGLLNGNVAVLQTMVAEMVKNPAHEPKAYAVQPFMWSLGSIIGSAMGGFLAQPARFYPSMFSPDGLFGKFPYLLPNLVAAVAIALAIIQGYFLLDETNPRFQSPQEPEFTDEADERTPLWRTTSRISTAGESQGRTTDRLRRPSFMAGGIPGTYEPSFDLRRTSVGTIHSITIRSIRDRNQTSTPMANVSEEPPPKAFNRGVVMLTIALIIMSYHQMAYNSLLPIYMLDEPHKPKFGHLDLLGGLGFDVHSVGVAMAVNGLESLVIQGLIFPIFVERVGVWRTFFSLTIINPIAYVFIPLLNLLSGKEGPLLAAIYVLLFVQNIFAVIIFPCALILLKQATTSNLVLGKVNGLAMSACSGARTVAPPLAGIIYGAAGSAVGWWSCVGFAILGAVQLYWIPREKVEVVSVENELFRRKSKVEPRGRADSQTVEEED